MANLTVVFGTALLALGLAGYFGTGRTSLTALIPAVFGIALVVLGALANDPGRRSKLIQIAAVVGMVGFLGSANGLAQMGLVLAGMDVANPAAVFAKFAMAVLTAIYVLVCVKWMRDVRRKGTAQ